MNRATLAILIASILAIVALTAGPVGGQIGPESPCLEGARWHLRAAYRYTESQDQEYHIRAAAAMQELDLSGDTCPDWETDARRPSYNGDTTAEGGNSESLQFATTQRSEF